jgi:hypothetical protein
MSLDHPALEFKPAPKVLAAQAHLAARLADIRAAISFLHAAPYSYGRLNGPHRRRRDEDIWQSIAADVHARLVESRAS